jgi:hypothetical protein
MNNLLIIIIILIIIFLLYCWITKNTYKEKFTNKYQLPFGDASFIYVP